MRESHFGKNLRFLPQLYAGIKYAIFEENCEKFAKQIFLEKFSQIFKNLEKKTKKNSPDD